MAEKNMPRYKKYLDYKNKLIETKKYKNGDPYIVKTIYLFK